MITFKTSNTLSAIIHITRQESTFLAPLKMYILKEFLILLLCKNCLQAVDYIAYQKAYKMMLELMNRQSFSFPKHFQVGKHDLSWKNRSCLYHSPTFQFILQYTQRTSMFFSSSCILKIQLKSFLPKLNENYRATKLLSISFVTTHYQITFWKALKMVMHRPGFLICLVSQTG